MMFSPIWLTSQQTVVILIREAPELIYETFSLNLICLHLTSPLLCESVMRWVLGDMDCVCLTLESSSMPSI